MKGNLTQEEEKNLEKKADFIRLEFDFKDVRYLGKGRYKILAEKTGKPGEQFYFMSKGDKQFFSIEHQADGTIKISAARFRVPDRGSVNPSPLGDGQVAL